MRRWDGKQRLSGGLGGKWEETPAEAGDGNGMRKAGSGTDFRVALGPASLSPPQFEGSFRGSKILGRGCAVGVKLVLLYPGKKSGLVNGWGRRVFNWVIGVKAGRKTVTRSPTPVFKQAAHRKRAC